MHGVVTRGLSSAMIFSLHSSTLPSEMERKPLKMVCGCLCGQVIKNKLVAHTILWPYGPHLLMYDCVHNWETLQHHHHHHHHNNSSNTLPFWSCSAHNGWQACGGHQGRVASPSGRSWSPGCTRGGPRWWTFPRHPPPSLWTEWWQSPVTNEHKNDGSDDMSCTPNATSLSDDSTLWEWTQKWCISWHVTSNLWVMTVTFENEHRSGILAETSHTSNATSLSDDSALWEWTQEQYISWHVTYIQCHISECWQHWVKRNIWTVIRGCLTHLYLWVMTVPFENEHRNGVLLLADTSHTSNATSLSEDSALRILV